MLGGIRVLSKQRSQQLNPTFLWAQMSCKYFSVPAPRAANGGQDQHQADAALWQGGRILKKLEPF